MALGDESMTSISRCAEGLGPSFHAMLEDVSLAKPGLTVRCLLRSGCRQFRLCAETACCSPAPSCWLMDEHEGALKMTRMIWQPIRSQRNCADGMMAKRRTLSLLMVMLIERFRIGRFPRDGEVDAVQPSPRELRSGSSTRGGPQQMHLLAV